MTVYDPRFTLIPEVETKVLAVNAALGEVPDVDIQDVLNRPDIAIVNPPASVLVSRDSIGVLLKNPLNPEICFTSYWSNLYRAANDLSLSERIGSAARSLLGILSVGSDPIDFLANGNAVYAATLLQELIDVSTPELKLMDDTTKNAILALGIQSSISMISWVQEWNRNNPTNPIRNPLTGEPEDYMALETIGAYKLGYLQ